MASYTAIVTDAFPTHQRGLALGINVVAATGGQFIGLLLGGLLAAGHLAAAAWLLLRGNAALVGDLHAAADRGIPAGRADHRIFL